MTDSLALKYSPPIEQLQKELRTLGDKMGKKGVTAGLKYAAKPVQSRQKSWAQSHRKTGALEKAVTTTVLGARTILAAEILNKPDSAAVSIGPNRKSKGKSVSYIGRFLEYGTKAHEIKPKRVRFGKDPAKALNAGGKFYRRVNVEGIRASGWIQKSVDGVDIGGLFYQGLSAFIDKQGPATE